MRETKLTMRARAKATVVLLAVGNQRQHTRLTPTIPLITNSGADQPGNRAEIDKLQPAEGGSETLGTGWER
ncbi:hypothetical protein CPC08DRAFT_714835, partial [Agrocybe pediades]